MNRPSPRKLLLVLLGAALGFVLSEAVTRRVLPETPVDHIVRTGAYDRVYHHRFRLAPPQVGPRRPGVPRICFVGDSFTEGTAGPGFTIPRILERVLEREHGLVVEAPNLGTSSYSPLLELLLVRNVVPELDPDLVVLLLDESDVQDDAYYETMARHEDGEVVAVDPLGLPYSAPWFHSKLVRSAVLAAILAGGGEVNDFTNVVYAWEEGRPDCARHEIYCRPRRMSYNHHDRPLEYWAPHYDRTLDYVGRIRDLCAERGVPFLLGIYPYPAVYDVSPHAATFRERWDYPLDRRMESRLRPYVRAWAAEHDVPLFDFHELVERHPDPSALYPGQHSHYNRAGNKLFAAALAARIVAGIEAGEWL